MKPYCTNGMNNKAISSEVNRVTVMVPGKLPRNSPNRPVQVNSSG